MRSLMPFLGNAVKAVIGSLACVCLIYYIVFLAVPPYSRLRVTVSLEGQKDIFQVSYRDTMSKPYQLADVETAEIKGGRGAQDVVFTLPAGAYGFLRFDPMTSPGETRLLKICMLPLDLETKERCWDAEGIQRDFIARDHISKFELSNKEIRLENIGSDPYFETKPELEEFLRTFTKRPNHIQIAITCILSLISFLVFILLSEISPAIPAWTGAPLKIVFLSLVMTLFLLATQAIRSLAPPLQGADEYDHVSKLVSAELGLPCGETPKALAATWGKVSYLAHHPELKWVKLPKNVAKATAETVSQDNGVCRYSSFYLTLPALFNQAMKNDIRSNSVLSYLWFSRVSLSFSAALCFLMPLILALFGRGVWKYNEENEQFWRMGAILCCLYMLFLPQTLWISSVVNQDYLLLASGLFLAIGVFFRIPFFSDWLNILCLAASISKGAYVLPFVFLIAAHYFALGCPGHFRNSKRASGALLLFAGGVTAAGCYYLHLHGQDFCQNYYCYGLERSGLFTSFSALKLEIVSMFTQYRILSLPPSFHFDSSFGNFGWLDTPMPSAFVRLYTAPITWVLGVGLLAFLGLALAALCRKEFRKSRFGLFPEVAFCIYWLLSFASLYVVFFAMMRWCGEDAEFGCGYQKRYELPLYAFVVYAIFLFSFDALSRFSERFLKRRNIVILLFTFVFFAQSICIWFSYRGMLVRLQERYYASNSANKTLP